MSSANISVPCSYSLESGIQSISIAKSSGLGLTISGGSNRPEGPMIYVQELMPDGDCYRVSQQPVKKESFLKAPAVLKELSLGWMDNIGWGVIRMHIAEEYFEQRVTLFF